MSSSNIYGNTVVESGGHAHLGNVEQRINVIGGVHLHYRIEEAESLQNILRVLEPKLGGSTNVEDAIRHLRALSSIFQQAEQIEAQCTTEDKQYVESLRAITADTSASLRDFQKCFEQMHSINDASHALSSETQQTAIVRWGASTRDEVNRLQEFANRQLQKINAIMHFMLRYDSAFRFYLI